MTSAFIPSASRYEESLGDNPRSADPLVDPDVDRVSRLLAAGGPQSGPHRQPVGAVALCHERASERFAVDHGTNLDQTPGTEKLLNIVDNDARPGAWVVSLLEGGVELFQHPVSLSHTVDRG